MSSYGVSLSSAPVPKPRFAGGSSEMAAAPTPAALMKSRRFQKSDSPVISELGMSEGGRISIGTPGQEQRERGRNGVSGNCPAFYLKLMRISPTGFPLTFLVSRLRFSYPVVGSGQGGIRTLDTLLTYTRSPGVRLQPL